MAGTIVPELYCSSLRLDRLTALLACTRKGAFRVGLSLKNVPGSLDFFRKRFPGALLRKDERMTRSLARAVEAAFFNTSSVRDPALDAVFTPFQKKVLRAVAGIPFGETRTYGEVARMVGTPGGARAVGQVMGSNRFPLLFP